MILAKSFESGPAKGKLSSVNGFCTIMFEYASPLEYERLCNIECHLNVASDNQAQSKLDFIDFCSMLEIVPKKSQPRQIFRSV